MNSHTLTRRGFSFLLLMAICLVTTAQCPTGNIFLDTQQAVNDFASQYPDCTNPTGDVYITGDDIWTFLPLGNITEINGSLEINNLLFINSLDGLNIVSIGDELRITDNTFIAHLNGLESLESIGGDLFVFNNPSLNTLNGLSGLESVYNLRLLVNTGISDISALSSLTEVNGYVHLLANPELTSLSGLENIESIPGDLLIEDIGMEELSGLSGLQTVLGNISISANQDLIAFDGLGIETIEGRLLIKNNPLLESIHGMNALAQIQDSLVIRNNPLLSDCDSYAICQLLMTDSEIIVADNADGCQSIEEIEEDCMVSSIDELRTPSISVYPNPANGQFRINGLTGTWPVRILNSQGKLVLNDFSSNSIDVSQLSSGIYIVEVFTSSGYIHTRLAVD